MHGVHRHLSTRNVQSMTKPDWVTISRPTAQKETRPQGRLPSMERVALANRSNGIR